MLSIALPEHIQAFVEQQAHAAGFETVGEYVYQLILREQERLAQAKVEALLLEGLDSGEPIHVTDEWWEQKQINLTQRFRQASE